MKLSEQLYNKAQALLASSPEHVAVEMLKKAGLSEDEARLEVAQHLMEKEAASALTASGIDFEEAMKMIKVANVKVKDLSTFKAEPSFEEMMAQELMKAAEQAFELEVKTEEVETLNEKVASLQAQLDAQPENSYVPPEIARLAKSGDFTNEDLAAMQALPQETLSKIASVQEEPWRLGKSASVTSAASQDPIMQFILGDN